jgi:hypothetical protein
MVEKLAEQAFFPTAERVGPSPNLAAFGGGAGSATGFSTISGVGGDTETGGGCETDSDSSGDLSLDKAS